VAVAFAKEGEDVAIAYLSEREDDAVHIEVGWNTVLRALRQGPRTRHRGTAVNSVAAGALRDGMCGELGGGRRWL